MSYSAAKLKHDLGELIKADEEVLAQAFKSANRGNFLEIQQLIKQYPGILSQAPKNNPKTNLINEIISGIITNEDKRPKLIRLLDKLVNKHPEKIDLSFVDANNNTLLHRVFWGAITINNPALSEAMLNIGIVLINLLKKFADFSLLMKRKDSLGNSFLQIIFSTSPKNGISPKVLEPVQIAVADNLNPLKNRNASETFTQKLAKLLQDPLDLEPLSMPLTCREGYTLSERSWENLKTGINPLSAKPFKRQELEINPYIMEIVYRFKRHSKNEESLVNSLNNFFEKLDGRGPQNPDKLFNEIKELLVEYNCLSEEKETSDEYFTDPDAPIVESFKTVIFNKMLNKLRTNIMDKANGRISCFTLNSKEKEHKLATISRWINEKGLDEDRIALALALIRDVCKIKRNPWGSFAPHSEYEFHTLMYQNGAYLQLPENYSYDPSLLLFLDKPHEALPRLDEYIHNLQRSSDCSP